MNSSPPSSSTLLSHSTPGWVHWRFTALLGFGYSLLFHLWIIAPRREAVILTALAASAWLAHELVQAARGGYFTNRWDMIFHAAVILDVLLEALVIPIHNGLGFYWCTLAFGIVIGGYRWFGLRSRARSQSPT